MDLNGYFDPVSLERPDFHLLPEKYSFSRNISIHTPDNPIRQLDNCQVALIGLPQDANAFIKGSKEAPDSIRGMLYQLKKINNNVNVFDLGNLKITDNIMDSYYAIRDVTLELIDRGVIPLFIGGSQDLAFGIILALEKLPGIQQILSVDPRLDFWSEPGGELHSGNYLNYIIDKDKKEKFVFSNLAHQAYFVADDQLDIMEKEYMESIRLGAIRDNLRLAEPLVRDSDFISIDMNVVRHSDAPGVTIPSPNGLFGDELCTLTRYGGLSEKVKVCGIFECNPSRDLNEQTSHLAAQSIWYFIDGLSHRVRENPVDTPEHTTKFIITMNEANQELIFHKSNISERWWIELPVKNPVTKQNFFVSCSYEDYQQACNHEIPDRWWRFLHRLGN